MTLSATPTHAAERIESLKAGIIGATAMLPILLLIMLIESHAAIVETPQLTLSWQDPTLWLKGASVLLSGFLFGATYRYIIRQDINPHLRSGAVMAFGLVRGLAQIEVSVGQAAPLLLSIRVLESLLLFAVAAWVLDWAIGQGWLKPFQSDTQS